MHLKNRRVMFLGLLVLAVLLLLGAGCKREEASAPPLVEDASVPAVSDASPPVEGSGPEIIPPGGVAVVCGLARGLPNSVSADMESND